jgi:ribosomal-protein-alanine N-acetyltransferase
MLRKHTRWMIQRDHREVLEIAGCTAYPWTAEQLATTIRKRNVIGMVAEDMHDRILGFAVYRLRPDTLEVIALAVGPYVRRQGVGHAMFAKLHGKLRTHGRDRMVARVRETDDVAVWFWVAMGARAMGVERGFFSDTREDAYRFERVLMGDGGRQKDVA